MGGDELPDGFNLGPADIAPAITKSVCTTASIGGCVWNASAFAKSAHLLNLFPAQKWQTHPVRFQEAKFCSMPISRIGQAEE
jgi:hypothetical protein